MEALEQKIARVVRDHVAVVPYDPAWPKRFEQERDHLRACLPRDLVKRIEHFGSTAVPGLAAKPIVDILVEVASLEETKLRIAPVLEAQGYDYFWRPAWDVDEPPYYAWFIKRDASGARTHHIHMVEAHFEHWDRLRFRDYLVAHPEIAREYGELKLRLSQQHDQDRVAYTKSKTEFVRAMTERAKRFFAVLALALSLGACSTYQVMGVVAESPCTLIKDGPCDSIPLVYGGVKFGACMVAGTWTEADRESNRWARLTLRLLMLPFAAFFAADLPFSAAADTILLPISLPMQSKYGDRCPN